MHAADGSVGQGEPPVSAVMLRDAAIRARTKITATYGVDIRDNGILGQIVDMAKQGFGGNLDMAPEPAGPRHH